jgi:ARID/BRIGHT DNA binding domain
MAPYWSSYALAQQQAPPTQQPPQQLQPQQPGAQGNPRPVPQMQHNTQMLRHFMLDYFKHHPIKRDDIPVVKGKPVDLMRFFAEVYILGGYEKVSFIIIPTFVASLIPLFK